jgi:hypothetical protein
MTQYRILPPASEELRSASRWYEQQRDGLGHALIDEFEERLALALAHPQAGTIVGSTTQRAAHSAPPACALCAILDPNVRGRRRRGDGAGLQPQLPQSHPLEGSDSLMSDAR